ncbi:unnamed protein product [Lactuca saligna]|uniref:Uncharacterized protein n=1 Tax=Lactuca saligna TaxID=75948 RepID=A0AA35V5I8_LACSI|nr:unnamed protein product [Lactuca saligna]
MDSKESKLKDEENDCGYFRWIDPPLLNKWYIEKIYEMGVVANDGVVVLFHNHVNEVEILLNGPNALEPANQTAVPVNTHVHANVLGFWKWMMESPIRVTGRVSGCIYTSSCQNTVPAIARGKPAIACIIQKDVTDFFLMKYVAISMQFDQPVIARAQPAIASISFSQLMIFLARQILVSNLRSQREPAIGRTKLAIASCFIWLFWPSFLLPNSS